MGESNGWENLLGLYTIASGDNVGCTFVPFNFWVSLVMTGARG